MATITLIQFGVNEMDATKEDVGLENQVLTETDLSYPFRRGVLEFLQGRKSNSMQNTTSGFEKESEAHWEH